jgi:hypothetical protein
MLPTKLNSKDVSGWAKGKLAGKKAGSKPSPFGKKKAPPPKAKPGEDDDDDDDPANEKDPEKAALKAKIADLKGKLTDAGIDPDDDEDDADAEDDDSKDGDKKAAGKPPAGKPKTIKDAKAAQAAAPDKGKAKAAAKDPKAAANPKAKATAPAPGKAAPPAGAPGVPAPDEDDAAPGDGDDAAAAAPAGKAPPDLKHLTTEPKDPMNRGGIDGPDPDDALLGEEETEIEQKLGDFAEVLEARAGELEELAGEVTGDLATGDPDTETVREAQSLIPDDLKQDLVEHMSAMEPEEILEFCQHLKDSGKIDDPDLLAAFLHAAAQNSTEDDDDEDQDEDEGETETDADEDV